MFVFVATVVIILLSWFIVKIKRPRIATATVTSAAATTTSPTSSASDLGGEYEVFLSFRGPDTRLGFTDFLYHSLDLAGIRTFLDDNELRVGEEIGPELLKAIKDSKISIPIFSKGYASSKWCLRELAQMVECMRSSGQKILPIFYDVEPADVRHQTGSLRDAFRQHQRKFSATEINQWKEALSEVGKLKGWHLKNDTNGHEGRLAQMVVSFVLLESKKNYMVVTDDLVGIEHHVKEMEKLLDVDVEDVRFVGIHGMGGIGKTTIAKFIYNKLSNSFQSCSFLSDVWETSQQPNGVVRLQSQFISNILRAEQPSIMNVDDGMNTIKRIVGRKKVFVVLDDVDDKSQITKLVGKPDWFGLGSRIIITTRNKGVFGALKMDGIYEPPFMDSSSSLILFSRHAFRSNSPPKDYLSLSRDIATTTGGLPLALEVIGSFLFGEKRFIWEGTLKKLKEIPDEHVQQKLRITYDALANEHKEMFLDIACLFIGKDRTHTCYMWDSCGFHAIHGLHVLCLRNLVKVTDDNELWMHDQLKDLGRHIASENYELGECSRVWNHDEGLEMLERQMGTKKVKALHLYFKPRYGAKGGDQNKFTAEDFLHLPNLRYLKVKNADLAGDFKQAFLELRWLNWGPSSLQLQATNFFLKKLVILDLSLTPITCDWQFWSQIKMARRLKVLNLSHCLGLTKTPNLSQFTALEILILSGCFSLVEIDPSIGTLTCLRELDFSESGIEKLSDAIANLEKLEAITAFDSDLEELPSNIGRLSSLRSLDLSGTKIFGLPASISDLSCLQTLDLSCCKELNFLSILPTSLTNLKIKLNESGNLNLSHLTKLESLSFRECWNLLETPEDIGKLSKLERLEFLDTGIRTLPTDIGTLCRLRYLILECCYNLQSIEGLPSSLCELRLLRCQCLQTLPDISHLHGLSCFLIDYCPQLMEIQGLEKLKWLKQFTANYCDKLCENEQAKEGLQEGSEISMPDSSKTYLKKNHS